jgi:hypothetical protein
MDRDNVKNKLRLGYGSEFQLLRMLGRHRATFSNEVSKALGNEGKVEWFDFPYSEKRMEFFDSEYTTLDFLENLGLDPSGENQKYFEYWPSTGEPQHWDLIGKTADGYIVLVEAKAHIKELISSTGASPRGSLPKIENAFALVRTRIGVTDSSPWTKNYYQLANHIFTCWYLNEIRKIPTVLLNVYFIEDERPDGYVCPQTVREWENAIQNEYEYLGISAELPFIKDHVKSVFIPVNGEPLQ